MLLQCRLSSQPHPRNNQHTHLSLDSFLPISSARITQNEVYCTQRRCRSHHQIIDKDIPPLPSLLGPSNKTPPVVVSRFLLFIVRLSNPSHTRPDGSWINECRREIILGTRIHPHLLCRIYIARYSYNPTFSTDHLEFPRLLDGLSSEGMGDHMTSYPTAIAENEGTVSGRLREKDYGSYQIQYHD